MADPFRKVRPGQKLRIPAEAYNAFIDAALAERRRRHSLAADGREWGNGQTVVLVQNQTGGPLEGCQVVGLGAPLWTPAQNETAYIQQPVFAAVAPDVSSYAGHVEGRWAVSLSPLPQGATGPAVVAGVCRAKVRLNATWHLRADAAQGSTDCLESYPGGSAVILDVDRTTAGAVRLATVRIGVSPYTKYEGVLDEELSVGSYAQMSVWELGPGGWRDSGYDATVWASRLWPANIPAGKKVTAYWHPQAMRLIVDAAEC